MAESDVGSVGVMLALLLNLHFSRWCVGLTLSDMEIALTQLDNDSDESLDTTTAVEFRCYCFLHFSVYYHPTTTPPQSLLLLRLLMLITLTDTH